MFSSFLQKKKSRKRMKLKALVVDDTEVMRMIVVMTLKDAGFDIVEADNGKQGLKLAKRENFDLVITDIRMPVMDGLQMIRKLRKLRQYLNTPILSLTNLNSDHFKQELKLAGANGWVQKPFGRNTLIETIQKLVA